MSTNKYYTTNVKLACLSKPKFTKSQYQFSNDVINSCFLEVTKNLYSYTSLNKQLSIADN
jgi:hypothetical protein